MTTKLDDESRPAIVINGDDLGRTSEVNAAMMESFRLGLISSATLMANMPGFAEACDLIRTDRLNGRVGVHLNLTQGQALTMPIRSQPALCRHDGELVRSGKTIWRLPRDTAAAIQMELAAQIEAVIAEGINPTHLDAHHSIHIQWPIGSIVASLARRYGIPAVRLARNTGRYSSPLTWTYKRLYNARLARAGLARTRYFGPAAEVLAVERLDGPAEAMVHPERDPEGRIVDCVDGASRFDTAVPLEPLIAQLKRVARPVSYAELTGRAAPG